MMNEDTYEKRAIRRTTTVRGREVALRIGGDAPILVQSMTNTDTADVQATASQVMELADAGSEIVRITVDRDEAARAVPAIYEVLEAAGYDIPLVGDFHYNGHRLLREYPHCAQALAKYRINPGNVGFGAKKDTQFAQMIEAAMEHDKPVRIGVNWGSLDQALMASMLDENQRRDTPQPLGIVQREALVRSAISSAREAARLGMDEDKIILSCKVSDVYELISVYRMLAQQCDYPLHLGLTEAGMGRRGIVASTAALSVLLARGIGDTIRVSLTPKPGESRTEEVKVARDILQAMGLRHFTPQVSACPGCGRTTSTLFQELAQTTEAFLEHKMPIWRQQHPEIVGMKVAVMGCIVNGPGESKHADIGISLPGTGEDPSMPVFIDGSKAHTLRGEGFAERFCDIIENYVEKRYKKL